MQKFLSFISVMFAALSASINSLISRCSSSFAHLDLFLDSRARFAGGPGNISEYLGNIPLEYYGGTPEELLGSIIANPKAFTECITAGSIVKQRSITPYKSGDMQRFIETTRSTDGDPADYAESAVSAAGSAVVTITEANLGESATYPFVYCALTIPKNYKGKYIVSLSLSAKSKEDKQGSTEAMRIVTSDKEDSVVILTNFLSKSAAPQPININVSTADARTLVVTALGLPDEAILTVVAPGATDYIKLAYERWANTLQ